MTSEPVPGTYQLLIQVAAPLEVGVGRLGLCHFPAGYYIYTGSARRQMAARLARHLAAEKRRHWHIDYLLTAGGVRVVGSRCLLEPECQINGATPGKVLFPGFGSSDCKAACGSHLKYLGQQAPLSRGWSFPGGEGSLPAAPGG